MLEFVRNAVKSWVMKVFLGLLVASFAVFGIGDVFSFSLGSSVANVGNQSISAERFLAAFNNETRAASQRFGQAVDSRLARQLGLDQQVLGRLAAEATLDQQMEDLSVSAPDEAVAEAILADPSFQRNGAFDQESYTYLIAQSGYSIELYEDQVRRNLARNQLTASLLSGATAPAGAAEAIFAFQGEERRFDFITLTTGQHAEDPGQPDDVALAAHHEANPDAFSAPETRDAVWLHVDVAALAPRYTVDEADVRDLYEQRAATYAQPERRALYQTIFDTEADAEAAKTRLDAGEIDFDALLAERGESRGDTSLGDVREGDIAEATANAAFASAGPGVVGPVDTGFGFALIDVAAVTPAETIPFEDARAELALELQRDEALNAAPGLAGEIEDLRAGGATLEEVAQELEMTLGSATGVSAEGGDGFTGERAFLDELFASEVGEEREVIETEEGDFFVLRLDAITPSTLRPLEDVRQEVVDHWRAAREIEALEAVAAAALERVDDGELLAVIADELGVQIETEGPKRRDAGWSALPPAQIQALFDEPMGGAETAAFPGAPNVITIAQVVEINAPAPDEAFLARISAQLDEMAGGDALELFLRAKQDQAGVEINAQLIDSLLTQSHGGGY